MTEKSNNFTWDLKTISLVLTLCVLVGSLVWQGGGVQAEMESVAEQLERNTEAIRRNTEANMASSTQFESRIDLISERTSRTETLLLTHVDNHPDHLLREGLNNLREDMQRHLNDHRRAE